MTTVPMFYQQLSQEGMLFENSVSGGGDSVSTKELTMLRNRKMDKSSGSHSRNQDESGLGGGVV